MSIIVIDGQSYDTQQDALSAHNSALTAEAWAAVASQYPNESYKGICTTATTPTVVAGIAQWWTGSGAGTYTNFGGLVVTGNFCILAYNGTSWSKYEASIATPTVVQTIGGSSVDVMSQGASTSLLVSKTEILSGNLVAYKNVHGDDEYVGDDEFGQKAVAYYQLMSSVTTFDKITFKARVGSGTANITVNIYQADSIGATPKPDTDWTLLATGTVATDATMGDRVLQLATAVTCAVNKYVVIAFSTKSVTTAVLRKWTTNPNSDRSLILYTTSTNYSTIFNETWAKAGAGYYSVPFLLERALPFPIMSEVPTIADNDSKLNIADFALGGIEYKNSRGDAEYVGDGSYTQKGVGCSVLLSANTSFNSVKVKAAATTGGALVYWKVYSATAIGSKIPDTDFTLLCAGSQVFDSNVDTFKTLMLDSTYTVATGKYVVVLFSSKSAITVIQKKWSTNEYSDRLGVYLCTSTNYSTIFAESWAVGSGEYMCVPPMLQVTSAFLRESDLDGLVLAPVTVNLPNTITAIVGDKLQVFFRSIIQSPNPYQYDILVTCAKGKQYPRYFEYTPVAGDVGTATFTIQVKDNNGLVLGAKTCNLVTKAVVQSPIALHTSLCCGDSLTAGGVWTQEASRRLIGSGGTPTGLELTNIAFKGRLTNAGVGWEGNGGWKWDDYSTAGRTAYRFTVSGVTTSPSLGAVYTNNGKSFTVAEVNITGGAGNIRCEPATGAPTASGTLTKSSGSGDATISFSSSALDAGNPFWNGGVLDFQNYVDTYMDGACDSVYFLLTWNGITAWKTDFTSMIADAKVLVDHIHTVYPSCKIKIMGIQLPSLNGGMGENYGATGSSYADTYGNVVTAMNMNDAYQAWANESAYSSFVEFVNVASQFDSENNMQEADVVVNSRSAKTEKRGTNGVHPATVGYYQIGDVVFRNAVSNFCQ